MRRPCSVRWLGATSTFIILCLQVCLLPRVYLGTQAKTPEVSIAKPETKPVALSNKTVNINRASSAELQSLPGVGPVTAQRIVDYRKKNPPFRKIEELLIIRGISRDRLEKIRSRISVE